METNSHAPGSFCWADLATTDAVDAKRFYGALFGWQFAEMPAANGATYAMCRLREKDVAALAGMSEAQRASGRPAAWRVHVSVKNVEETLAKVVAAGGTVLAPPFDLLDLGRMGVFRDPSGAVLSIWQPKTHAGAQIVGEPSTQVWSELMTRDVEAAKRFYGQVFGWRHDTLGAEMGGYVVIHNGDDGVGGIMPMPKDVPASVGPYWGPYFAVASCDDSVARASALGATVVVPPTDIPRTGRFATFADPQGAVLSILEPMPM